MEPPKKASNQKQKEKDTEDMDERIKNIRTSLVKKLKDQGIPTEQICKEPEEEEPLIIEMAPSI